MNKFKSGYVNILGLPNAGKSTLFNQLVGEKLAIITPKPQTTRKRILGILNDKNYQIIFSDTPGILEPKYGLHNTMMSSVEEAFEDSDVIIYIIDIRDSYLQHQKNIERIKSLSLPYFLLINKIDLMKQEEVLKTLKSWETIVEPDNIIIMSALHNFNLDNIKERIIALLPEHEAYFPKDMITDKNERFIASEMIREKIFLLLKQEVPYSTEVTIEKFKDEEKLLSIDAMIYVNRKSQKPILIGKEGSVLKRIGTDARKDMEAFFNKKIFLSLYVKVRENWRDKPEILKQFGYNA